MNYANHENDGFVMIMTENIATKNNIANEDPAFLHVTNCMQAG